MDNPPSTLQEILKTLESEDTLDLNRVTSLLDQVDCKSSELTEPDKMMLSSERMAFRFAPDSDFGKTNWGTYYGPCTIINDGDNKVRIGPSIDRVTPEMLEYWIDRANEATHPILRARYADLVWDFSSKVTGKPAGVALAQMAIDSGVEAVVANRCKYFFTAWSLLKRSLRLALSLHDDERAKRTVAVAIDYDDAQSKPGARNAWGHSFDTLLNTKGVPLTDDQRNRIIAGLENSLSVSSSATGNGEFHDPFAAKDAAQRLVDYYRRHKHHEDVRRVVALFGEGVISASNNVDDLMASAWLKDAFDFAASSHDKDTADRLAFAMRQKPLNIKDKGQVFKWESEITPELIEKFLSELLEGDEDEALSRIVSHYVPKWDEQKEQVLRIAKTCVFTSIIRQTIVDPSGREVASVGSVEDDLEGRVVLHMANNMNYVAYFLCLAFQRWFSKFEITVDKLCERLLSSPVFTQQAKCALSRGLRAYFEKDHVTAIHLLLPQVEAAIREFLIGGGVSIYRQNKFGGIDYRTLGDMLGDALVKEVFGEDVQRYFKVLLVDSRGWNLRNTVCHGIADASVYVQSHSDRTLHVLLLFSLLKRKSITERVGDPYEH